MMKSLDPSFYNDIFPLLGPEALKNYNVDVAFDKIIKRVCPLFKGKTWIHNLTPTSPLTQFINLVKKLNTTKISNKEENPVMRDLQSLATKIKTDVDLMKKARELKLDKKIKQYGEHQKAVKPTIQDQ